MSIVVPRSASVGAMTARPGPAGVNAGDRSSEPVPTTGPLHAWEPSVDRRPSADHGSYPRPGWGTGQPNGRAGPAGRRVGGGRPVGGVVVRDAVEDHQRTAIDDGRRLGEAVRWIETRRRRSATGQAPAGRARRMRLGRATGGTAAGEE